MEEKRLEEVYRGHEISVSAWEQRRGVWSWVYLIGRDVEGASRTGATLPDADAALRRGLLAARARADELGNPKR